jgi:hypothetical protein
MAIRGASRMSDWEFIRAAQVEKREMEGAHDVSVKLEMGLDSRRSVVVLRATAYEVDIPGADRQLAAYQHEWPSAKVETFGAALFQTLVRLTRLVEDSRRDEALEQAKRL